MPGEVSWLRMRSLARAEREPTSVVVALREDIVGSDSAGDLCREDDGHDDSLPCDSHVLLWGSAVVEQRGN